MGPRYHTFRIINDAVFSKFKILEEKGTIPSGLELEIPDLCRSLIHGSVGLLKGMGESPVSREFLDDLTLLTLGPQLRGGRNNAIGAAAIVRVFDIIKIIVKNSISSVNANQIVVKNASNRIVIIEFSPDPDIIIREEMQEGEIINILAIEIKGGTDFSNIHNRLGEAEKSHQKARLDGFPECWTIVNVERMDLKMAKKESPSTNHFYQITQLSDPSSPEFKSFRNRIASLTGIAR